MNVNFKTGGRAARTAFEFGRTYVVRPKGKHQATVVWLHGLGDNGSRYLDRTFNSFFKLNSLCGFSAAFFNPFIVGRDN